MQGKAVPMRSVGMSPTPFPVLRRRRKERKKQGVQGDGSPNAECGDVPKPLPCFTPPPQGAKKAGGAGGR
ncbi:hypothetical protein KDI_12110 [Dictyobacter arantiisoli]|uniref:Uncharacterized protein n=1 Tax=Dictyobacter arantiisoli TaxID=2014874 RepID=A0A5A5T8G7_9CHLR|nr:hypothetical protein KDI_12110 [Dictyobacter arantiisoli]